MTHLRMSGLERRLLLLGLGLTVAGCLLTWFAFGAIAAWSFLTGAALAVINLGWLRSSVHLILADKHKRSKSKVLAGFFLRLLLIPLCLYVMIRFLFLNILAAVAGFALLLCSVFVEGILEAFGSSPD